MKKGEYIVELRNAISKKYKAIVLVMLMGLLLIAATDKKEEAVEFDFKKTSAYIHEMDARPGFPDTITFARDYVYSIQALEEKIDPKAKEKIIDFTRKIQRPDGGFSIDPEAKETNSLYTDFAVETLSYLGAVNSIDSGKVKSYLSSLQRPDGGFAFNVTAKESSLQTTYFAVHVLSCLNGLDIVDKAKTAAYIKGFEKKDSGGFSYTKGNGVANVKNTYMGVFTLNALGMLDEQTKKNAIKYFASTLYIGRPEKYEVTQTLAEQAYAIMTLKMLGAENRINKEGVVSFLKGFYLPLKGGFAPKHGNAASPDPTYFAICSMAELGILKKPVETGLQ